jgi:uncharacterized membrane protein
MVRFSYDTCSSGFVLAAFTISGGVFWPYFAGGAAAIVGLCLAPKNAVQRASGLDKLVPFGPLFFAIAMAIFGADHFMFAKFVAMLVPSWIPGHLFWAYFVGVALVAAALSLVTRIQSQLAAALLGVMIFLFVVLLHIPSCFAHPHDQHRLTLLLRDLALSAGALAYAVQSDQGRVPPSAAGFLGLRFEAIGPKLITVARYLVAISIADFGVNHFLHPTFAPGIPQDDPAVFLTMPSWIPGHVLWAYLTGAIFIVGALGILTRRWARSAAEVLGLTVLVLILFVYLPLTVAKPSDIANGLNYLAIHFALAGAALLLAGALPAN